MTKPMTRERLSEIKARYEAATEGPWFDAGNKIGADGHGIAEVEFDEQSDMDFCVNARQDLPDCIAEIERLTTALRNLYNDCRNEPCDEQRGKVMDEARKALEQIGTDAPD